MRGWIQDVGRCIRGGRAPQRRDCTERREISAASINDLLRVRTMIGVFGFNRGPAAYMGGFREPRRS